MSNPILDSGHDETHADFGGVAGEVLHGLLHPGTLLTALPVAAALVGGTLLAGAMGYFLGSPGSMLGQLFMTWLFAWLIGRFACAARTGELDAGFLSAEAGGAMAFSVRYLLASLVWSLPVGLLVLAGLGGMFSNPLGWTPGPLDVALIGVMVVLSVLGPLLALLVATKTWTWADVFLPDTWLELLNERRGDLFTFVAVAIGGFVLLLVLFSLPLALVGSLLALVTSMGMLLLAGGALFILPVALAPILLGRLAGGFVYAENVTWTDTGSVISSTLPSTIAGRGHVSSSASLVDEAVAMAGGQQPRSMQEIIAGVEAITGAALPEAIAQARSRLQEGDLRSAFELALLLARRDDENAAVQAASEAMGRLAPEGLMPMVLHLYQLHASRRNQLKLPAPVWESLGRALQKNNRHVDAAWCLFAGNRQDPLRAQKQLIDAGNRAAEAGEHRQAVRIYESFLKHFPDSQFTTFVRDELDRAQRHQSGTS